MGDLLLGWVFFLFFLLFSPLVLVACATYMYRRITRREFRKLSIALTCFSLLIGVANFMHGRGEHYAAIYAGYSSFLLTLALSVGVVWYVKKASEF